MNAVARKGEINFLESLSEHWAIPIMERHLKLLLAQHWYTQSNGGSPNMRLHIARKLLKCSNRYHTLVQRMINEARAYNLVWSEIVIASRLGDEIGKPLTLEELMNFMMTMGKEESYQGDHVPFALAEIMRLVGSTTSAL